MKHLRRSIVASALFAASLAASSGCSKQAHEEDEGCPGGGVFPHTDDFLYDAGGPAAVCGAQPEGGTAGDAGSIDATADALTDAAAPQNEPSPDAGPNAQECCASLCLTALGSRPGTKYVTACSITDAPGTNRLHYEWTQSLLCR